MECSYACLEQWSPVIGHKRLGLINGFKIVLQGASVSPRSSGVYFGTYDVIVFIIFNMATVY